MPLEQRLGKIRRKAQGLEVGIELEGFLLFQVFSLVFTEVIQHVDHSAGGSYSPRTGLLRFLGICEAPVRAFVKSTRTRYVLGTGTRWVRRGTYKKKNGKKIGYSSGTARVQFRYEFKLNYVVLSLFFFWKDKERFDSFSHFLLFHFFFVLYTVLEFICWNYSSNT